MIWLPAATAFFAAMVSKAIEFLLLSLVEDEPELLQLTNNVQPEKTITQNNRIFFMILGLMV